MCLRDTDGTQSVSPVFSRTKEGGVTKKKKKEERAFADSHKVSEWKSALRAFVFLSSYDSYRKMYSSLFFM